MPHEQVDWISGDFSNVHDLKKSVDGTDVVFHLVSTLAIEKYLQLYERLYGLTAISLRVANPYGERQRIETAQGVIAAFLHRVMSEMPIDIWGDGSVTRDYLHISDVVAAFVKASTYEGRKRVFNISSGVGISLESLVKVLESVMDKKIKRKYLQGRPFDVPVSILSNDLARNELGWSPTTTALGDGLLKTINWIKKNRE